MSEIGKAVERSISHNEIVWLDVESLSLGLEELGEFGLDDYVVENDGSVDVWGGEGGGEWRLRLREEVSDG